MSQPLTALLGDIVRRIVEVAQPDRIILFGSAARGEIGPDSDIDLLVVKSGVPHRRRLAQEIYANLFGVTVPVDVVVVTPEDIERFAGKVGTIITPALAEVRFPKTHVLSDLLSLAAADGVAVPDEVREAHALTPYAVGGRLPRLGRGRLARGVRGSGGPGGARRGLCYEPHRGVRWWDRERGRR